MKVKCTSEFSDGRFTFGRVYEVTHIDADGDYWTTDDEGYAQFLWRDEFEVIEE